MPNAFSVPFHLWTSYPGLKQPWAEISQRLRRMVLSTPPRVALSTPLRVVLFILLLVTPITAQEKQGVVLETLPAKVDTSARYLFYLHGRIVERGRRPISPDYGPYEYDQILDTFKQRGFVVISEQRTAGTDVEKYAEKVASQIKQLLKAGVPTRNITVVGASQGSYIAMLVSTYLKNRDLSFVFMAACSAEARYLEKIDWHGKVLSIYESTDGAGSCEKYRADATGVAKYQETQLRTGLRHGFIYRPMTEWIEPTIAWARGL